MATLAQLEQALIQADQAGNVEDATALANEIRRLQAEEKALASLEAGLQEEKTTRKKQKSSRYIKINSSWCCARYYWFIGITWFNRTSFANKKSFASHSNCRSYNKIITSSTKNRFYDRQTWILVPEQQQIMGAVEQIPAQKL